MLVEAAIRQVFDASGQVQEDTIQAEAPVSRRLRKIGSTLCDLP
jgi:hypothetical protein